MSHANGHQEGKRTPTPATERRREFDARQREAGCTRVGIWLSAERIAEIDELKELWQLPDRTQAIVVAIRFLAKQSRTLARLEL